MNRMTRQADPKGNVTTFSYDSNGNRLTMTDAAGKITRFTYDSMNRLASLTDPAGAVTSYTRDLRGLVTLKTDPLNKNTNLAYDAAGRLTNYTDPNGFALGYAYDQFGNATQLTYPDGTVVTYGYDVLNRLATVTDPQGDTASYTYDIAGNLDIFTHFNGIITTYSHDAASRLIGMGSIVSDYQFTLDVNGNRIHSSQNEPLSASRAAASISYGYNTKKNRLLSAGSTSYTYDNEGQLSTAGSTAYAFDYDHRVAGIGNDTRFTYDGGGNRLSATRAGLTTRYIYDPWGNLLAEADASNQITRKYIHGKGLIALVTPSSRYCYHFNGTGHTIALTDMAGAVVNSYAYESFGQILVEQETIAQPFKYVGQYGVMAEPSGLYYMRARYYDPSVGRFISEDPIGFGGGDVNLFAYVRGNPTNFVDPWGTTGVYTGGGPPFVIPDNDAVYKLIQKAFASATPTGDSGNKPDLYHAAAADPCNKSNAITNGKVFVIPSKDYFASLLLQVEGTFYGQTGIYEYIVPINSDFFLGNPILTHQTFVPGAPISGVPNNWYGKKAPPFGGL